MASLAASNNYSPWTWAEVRSSMRDALRSPWVVAVLILCSTVAVLAVLFVVGWLLYANRDPAVVVSLINTAINAFLLKQMATMDGRVRTVETQTNGHTTRLMEAALKREPK